MKLWFKLGCAFLLTAVLLVQASYRIRDPDIWLYLRSGEILLTEGRILTADEFSYTFPGRRWVNHSWLSQGALAAFYLPLGIGGLFLARYLLLAGAFLLVFSAAGSKAGGAAAAVLTAAAMLAAADRFVVRPELFTFLFLAFTVFLLEKERDSGKAPLFLIPPLFLIWANLHGGFVLGLAVLIIYCAGETVMAKLGFPRPGSKTFAGEARPITGKRRRNLLLATLAAGAVAFVNPNGPAAYYYSSHIDQLRPYIYAWQPFPWGMWPHWSLPQFSFILLFALAVVFFALDWKRANLSQLAVLAVFGLAAARATRNTIPFAFLVPTLIASRLPGVLGSKLLEGRPARVFAAAFLAAGLAIAGARAYIERDPGRSDIHAVPGFGISPFSYPLETAEFIAENRIEGRLFNSFGIGNYLTWRLWPEKRNYVDGRLSVFGLDFLLLYDHLLGNPESFPDQAGEWGFRGAVVDHPNPSNRRLLSWLETSPDWALVFFDSNSAFFLHRDHPSLPELSRFLPELLGAAAGLSPREAFARGRFLFHAGREADALPFLLAAGKGYPQSRHIETLLAGSYLKMGDLEKGLARLERAIELGGRGEWFDLVLAQGRLVEGRREEARELARKILRDDPENREALKLLGRSLMAEARLEEAGSYLRKAAEGGVSSNLALLLGEIGFRTGDYRKAIEWYGRVEPTHPEYPYALIYLGGSYVHAGRLDEGQRVFERCAREFPAYADICRYNLAEIARRRGREEEAREILETITDPAIRLR